MSDTEAGAGESVGAHQPAGDANGTPPFEGIRLGSDTIFQGANDRLLEEPARRRIEAWLAALLQSEHLSLLVGNGLSTGVGSALNSWPPSMTERLEAGNDTSRIRAHADVSAERAGRDANFEDDIRSALALAQGYEILGQDEDAERLGKVIDEALTRLIAQVLEFERALRDGYADQTPAAHQAATLLQRFLLTSLPAKQRITANVP